MEAPPRDVRRAEVIPCGETRAPENRSRMAPTPIEIAGTVLFVLAVVHTFLTQYFAHLARLQPAHAGFWHLLGEVEVVFGFWAFVFVLFYVAFVGAAPATQYLDGLSFVEPMFVFVIMVTAASKPILELADLTIRRLARFVPAAHGVAFYFTVLSFTPLLGSFITEPAAMTLAALLLREHVFAQGISRRLKYITLGVLFVNVSIGGTLTPYAAPPILMVAGTWGWDFWFTFSTFGWKAAIAVLANAALAAWLFRAELQRLPVGAATAKLETPIPLIGVHLAFLVLVVVFAHHPKVFFGLFLFFLGVTYAYPRYQNPLILREGLLVAFFLAGLVTLGTPQRWWLQDVLAGMDSTTLFFGAAGLTAVFDNAALTYLGSLVQGVDAAFQYALVAGAVAGGGLTVIANAPNPAGFAILRRDFDDGAISPFGLLLAALPPTVVAILAFQLL
jgi:hypothetical protein